MPITCPKCGTANPNERHTCQLCGAELVPTARSSRRQDLDALRDSFGGDLFGPPPELKGRYTIGRAISQGDKVNLYRATDRQTGQPCLVHQTSLTMLDMDMREVLEQRFLQEAARWQARRHPNILSILDADVQNHRLYLITRPVRGQSLRALIRDRSYVVPEHTLLGWAEQLCDALEYLHGQNPPLVLGCLAPAAIHVDEAGQVQIIEVGLIRHEQSGLFGTAKGVPGYAAPEQRQNQVTMQSDLYTLGIILYQIITRFDPKERPLPPLSKHGEGYTPALLDAISVAYRREPEKRYASAAEMREALLDASPSRKVRLPPLELFEGQTVRTIPELAQTCAAHWDEGLLALLSGRIAVWLSEAESALREQGQDTEAVQVHQALERTQRAHDEMARPARPGQEEIAHNAALQSWLQDLGAAGIQPRLETKPARFDFGIVAPAVRARSAIQIRNTGRGYLTGRVESRVPWISVPQPVWGCPAQQSVEVRVEVSGRSLPLGDVQSQQALAVWSNGGETMIAAQVSSSPPVLDVQPRTLDYGPITRGAARVAHLVLSNKGGGRLSGRVSSKAPWLRIRNAEFSCPAGASARIPVELLSGQLPTGAVRIRRALTIDSDSGQASADVAWQWARPALELDSLGLDFESARRGEQIRRTLTLSNSGTADLTGTVQSRVPWLQAQPAELTCAPGSTQKITVVCDTTALPGGSTVEAEALVIAANAGTQTLSASVEVLAPELTLDTDWLDLGEIANGEQAEATLMIANHGSTSWEGTVRPTVDWLQVEPQTVVCPPGHALPVTVVVHADALAQGGEWPAAQAILVQGMGEQRRVGARVFLSRPMLHLERRSVDFGLIGKTEVSSLPLEIANAGTGELRWRVETQGTWIEATPAEGVCGTGQTATVQVNAYALAVGSSSGQAWITVRSNGGRVDLPARVGLSAPQLAVEPLTVEFASENYEPAAQTVWIFNRGVGTLSGAVTPQVSWLSVEPSEWACEAGMSLPVQVQADPQGQREGTHQIGDALLVESNAGRQTVSARLTLELIPRLHIETQELVFVDTNAAQVLPLENQGYGSLRVRVTPLDPWITVDRQEWTIKPQKKARVRVSVQEGEAAQGNIEIQAGEQTMHLLVKRLA